MSHNVFIFDKNSERIKRSNIGSNRYRQYQVKFNSRSNRFLQYLSYTSFQLWLQKNFALFCVKHERLIPKPASTYSMQQVGNVPTYLPSPVMGGCMLPPKHGRVCATYSLTLARSRFVRTGRACKACNYKLGKSLVIYNSTKIWSIVLTL